MSFRGSGLATLALLSLSSRRLSAHRPDRPMATGHDLRQSIRGVPPGGGAGWGTGEPPPGRGCCPIPPYCPPAKPGAAMPTTFRTRRLLKSEKKRLPAASIATPKGRHNRAAVAGPPSPAKLPGLPKPAGPLPATVLIVPAGLTLRIRLLSISAKKRVPAP